MVAKRSTLTLTFMLWLGAFIACTFAQWPVGFDVNPLVVSRPVDPIGVNPNFVQSQFVDIKLNVSSLIDSRFRGDVAEFVLRVESRRRDVQVADYWPKTEMASQTVGNISVASQLEEAKSANLRGFAAYPGIGAIDGDASYRENVHLQKTFAEKPSMELVTASGTIARRTGAYFKFKATPQTSLEGDHPIELVLEVPLGWRGDLLEVNCEAMGRTENGRSLKIISQNRFLVATYVEGDAVAAKVAQGHAVFEQRLRQTAANYHRQIEKTNAPTPFHKLGLALDIVDPEIPAGWLNDVLFSRTSQYPTGSIGKLPVDVRVAILDYIDHQQAMDTLANFGKVVGASDASTNGALAARP